LLPNFLIAGGVASGTSFLSSTLANHPDIFLPKIHRPEPNFFHYSWKFSQGVEWYQNTLFQEVGSQKAVGERSSLLLTSNVAARRIKDILPDIKLIFCLRNPIERAWANYRFTVLEGFEPLPFNEALEKESKRMSTVEGKWIEIQPHAYLTRSHYSTHIREYLQLFHRENILFIKSEDLGKNPHQNLKRICEFLGVDPRTRMTLPPNFSAPSVLDRHIQVEIRNYFGERFPQIVECIRKAEDFSTFVLADEDSKNLTKLKANLGNDKNPMPREVRLNLRSTLAHEIEEIRTLVDFCVDDWV
jgi:hypothetical protein